MEVAEQRNGKALQACGPALEGDLAAYDSGTIWLEQDRIGG